MEYQAHGPFHEECRVMINHVASYQMNISDAYLSMACYYGEDTEFPPFAVFFEQQAEVKREHAKQFLRYLRKREGKICLPVIQRPAMDNWGTGVKALKSALFMENVLSKLLKDLQTSASDTGEKDLFHFVGEFLEKQNKNINYLEYHLACMEQLEKSTEPSAECSGST